MSSALSPSRPLARSHLPLAAEVTRRTGRASRTRISVPTRVSAASRRLLPAQGVATQRLRDASLPFLSPTHPLNDATQTDAAFFHCALNAQKQVAAFAQQWTAYKNAARNGTDPSLGPAPVPPTLGTAPAAVAPGIFKRLTALVTRIKAHPGYTEAIGQDLNIIGAEQTVDTGNAKPALKLELAAGHPNVKWPKGGFDAVEIWVDRGAGFSFLAIDTVPDYLDTAPLPAPGASAVWKYKAIYRVNDTQVGQWSDVVSLAVTG